jgi:hypothetical protein
MKNRIKTNYNRIIGVVERMPFLAEIHRKEHVILCSSGEFGGLLPNLGTEKRASQIAKRALKDYLKLIIYHELPLLKNLLYVEVQTCFDPIRVVKVTGLSFFYKGYTASYERLSDQDMARVMPLLPGFIDRLKTEKVVTPSPTDKR